MKNDFFTNDLEGAAEYEKLRSQTENSDIDLDEEEEDEDEGYCNCSDPCCPCGGTKRGRW